MQDSSKICEFLNRDGFTSGSELGSVLGISRMAVQKRIQALIDLGLPVTASRGLGYRLDQGVTLLEAANIESLFIPTIGSLVESVEVFQSIASTNSYLLSRSFEKNKTRACLAESQTAGRGRRGNDWQSAPYRNIMLSVSWSFDHWPTTITGLGLAAGLVLAEYLNAEHGAGVTIKWPNDLLIGKNKLGGILVDVAGESSGACNVVIGVGLNVHQPNWSTEASYQWQDLGSLGMTLNRNILAADLISVLSGMLREFSESGFSPLAERWNDLSSYAGQRIQVVSGEQAIIGQMCGVDELGVLLVESGSEIMRINDSSASVRLMVS